VDLRDSRHALLVFSAKHPSALQRLTQNLESYLGQNPESLHDLGYTLSTRRELLSHRAFCVTDGAESFNLSRINRPSAEIPGLVFTFTGQGAQWARMGSQLLKSEPMYLQSFSALDEFLSKLPDAPKWTLRGEFCLYFMVYFLLPTR
jgi:acyl transferase domain-containing protein